MSDVRFAHFRKYWHNARASRNDHNRTAHLSASCGFVRSKKADQEARSLLARIMEGIHLPGSGSLFVRDDEVIR